MGAKYIMQEMNDLHREGETLLYPRLVAGEPCGTDELVSMAFKYTTYGEGEVKGMLSQLADYMAWVMAQGRSVKLEGIGTFSPSLGLRRGKEREAADGTGTRRNAASIEVRRVHFRPDKQLVREVDRQCSLERDSHGGRRHVSPYTPEQRLDLARRYLQSHATMSVAQYAALTGLSRTVAGRELRRWYRDTPGSGIGAMGFGSHRLYVARPDEAGDGNP